MADSTIKSLAHSLVVAVSPLKEIFSDDALFKNYFAQFGWDVLNRPLAYQSLIASIEAVVEDIENLPPTADVGDYLNIVTDVGVVYQSIQSIANSSSNAPSGVDATAFLSELVSTTFDWLVIRYLQAYAPKIYGLLRVFQVISIVIVPASTGRKQYSRETINYGIIGTIVTNPLDLIKSSLGWNLVSGPLFDVLSHLLFNLLSSFGIVARQGIANGVDILKYRDTFSNQDAINKKIRISIFSISLGSQSYDFGLTILDSVGSTIQDSGFIFAIDFPASISLEQQINDSLSLTIEATSLVGNELAVLLKLSGIDVKFPSDPTLSLPEGGIRFNGKYEPDSPMLIFGAANSTRLELAHASIGTEIIYQDDFEFSVEIDLSGLLLTIDTSDTDNFISKVFGEKKKVIPFPLIIRWSSKTGITFKGSGSFEVSTSPNLPIGPIKIKQLLIALKAISGQPIKTEIGATISGVLGPIAFVVENIGLSMQLQTGGGNAGPFGIDIGFKPPTAIGLQVDAKAVTGGGYVYFDRDKGRYYGAIELNIKDKISVTAVGIITTKNPDGSPGFSLLILVNVSFSGAGVPIAFGFSLNGVGGMGGVNRNMNPEALRLGVKTGVIDNIMFPQNVVENIQGIITDLERYFPIQQKRYTFGIFFLLKWGVGIPVLTIKLGVIISMPSPVLLAIVGVMQLRLPNPDDATLKVNVAFVGIIDFENKYLTFDATIYDSNILSLSISGDMAVRVFWGDHREMLLSVGGFHPAFNTPAYLMLPANMDRITISLCDGDYLTIKFQTYFAVTSNTVQFGARLDIKVEISELRVLGWFSFDVLFQFNPFRFMSHATAGLAVMWGDRELMCISLDFNLDGPGPWHAVGHAEFTALGISRDANFDKTWGDTPPATAIPNVTLFPDVKADLQKKESWETTMPDSRRLTVQLKQVAVSQLVLDPLGTITVTQKKVPLGVNVERYGTQKVTDAGVFNITKLEIEANNISIKAVTDNFAPAQFKNISDENKLKAASFEYMKSGVKGSGTEEFHAEVFVTREVKYDVAIIDNKTRTPLNQLLSIDASMVNNFARGGLVSGNSISKELNTIIANPLDKAVIRQEKFKLVSKDTMAELSTFSSYSDSISGSRTEAMSLRDSLIAANPALAGQLEAVPVYA